MPSRRASRRRARQIFIDSVLDVMKECDENYSEELSRGLQPFIEVADRMARTDQKGRRAQRES